MAKKRDREEDQTWVLEEVHDQDWRQECAGFCLCAWALSLGLDTGTIEEPF
jgi:hypothetical protein